MDVEHKEAQLLNHVTQSLIQCAEQKVRDDECAGMARRGEAHVCVCVDESYVCHFMLIHTYTSLAGFQSLPMCPVPTGTAREDQHAAEDV